MNSTWSLSLSLFVFVKCSSEVKKVTSRFSSLFPFVHHFDTCWKSNIVVRDQRHETEKKREPQLGLRFTVTFHTQLPKWYRARYRFHLWHVCLSICLVKMMGWSDGLRGVSMLFPFGYLARCRSTHHISTWCQFVWRFEPIFFSHLLPHFIWKYLEYSYFFCFCFFFRVCTFWCESMMAICFRIYYHCLST